MKKKLLLCQFILLSFFLNGQSAYLQIIHNSPAIGTDSGPVFDLYINGIIQDETQNMAYQTATPFMELPATATLDIAVALHPSNSPLDAFFTTSIGSLEEGESYFLFINGVWENSVYPFELLLEEGAKLISEDPEAIEVSFFNGAIASPSIDLDARLQGSLFGNLEYGEYNSYVLVPPALYYWDVRPTGETEAIASFEGNLSELAGTAFMLFASGTWSAQPNYGLFAVLPNGTMVPLVKTGAARVQLIHSAFVGPVDVYLNGNLFLDNLEYLTATPYFFLRSDVTYEITITGSNSAPSPGVNYLETSLSLEDRATEVLLLAGAFGDNTFDLFRDESRELGSSISNLDVKLFNGWPDAPQIELNEWTIGNLSTNLEYGTFSDNYISLFPMRTVVNALNENTEERIGQFYIDLSGGGGLSGVLFSNGYTLAEEPFFNWYLVLRNGAVIPLIPVAAVQFIHNAPANSTQTLDLYANDNLFLDDFSLRDASSYLLAATRANYSIGLAAPNSQGPEDITYVFPTPLRFEDGKDYVAMLSGFPANNDTPFRWIFHEAAKTNTNSGVDLLFYQGAPEIVQATLFSEASAQNFEEVNYGSFDGYINFESETYQLEFSDNNGITREYYMDLTPYEGLACTLFSSGLLNEEPDNNLHVWMALPDGTSFPLEEVLSSQQQQTLTKEILITPNPTKDWLSINFELQQATSIQIEIYDINGRLLQQKEIDPANAGEQQLKLNVKHLVTGSYLLVLKSSKAIFYGRFIRSPRD